MEFRSFFGIFSANRCDRIGYNMGYHLHSGEKKYFSTYRTILFATISVSKLEKRLVQTQCRHPKPRIEIIRALKPPYPCGDRLETEV